MAEIDFYTRQMALSYFPYKFIVSPIVLLPWFKSSSVTLNIYFLLTACYHCVCDNNEYSEYFIFHLKPEKKT